MTDFIKLDPEDLMLESSSSSSSDDDAMFPDPTNSTLNDNLAPFKAQPSGLSPPHSQELHDPMDTAEGSHEMMKGSDQLTHAAYAAMGIDQNSGNGNGWEPKSDFAKSAELVHEPGSCWNNKKAREEWHKAWNQIEDKNFSLSEYWMKNEREHRSLPVVIAEEFGDPFDESEEKQEKQENGK